MVVLVGVRIAFSGVAQKHQQINNSDNKIKWGKKKKTITSRPPKWVGGLSYQLIIDPDVIFLHGTIYSSQTQLHGMWSIKNGIKLLTPIVWERIYYKSKGLQTFFIFHWSIQIHHRFRSLCPMRESS